MPHERNNFVTKTMLNDGKGWRVQGDIFQMKPWTFCYGKGGEISLEPKAKQCSMKQVHGVVY